MSALQKEVIQSLNGMSDENLSFLLDMIRRFMQPAAKMPIVRESEACRIGIFEQECLYEDDYDIDEYNPEIARIFGVNE